MDRDGNAGVLYERMARAMVLCSMAQGDPAERQVRSWTVNDREGTRSWCERM